MSGTSGTSDEPLARVRGTYGFEGGRQLARMVAVVVNQDHVCRTDGEQTMRLAAAADAGEAR